MKTQPQRTSQGNAGPPQVFLTPTGGGLGAARPWGRTELTRLAELIGGMKVAMLTNRTHSTLVSRPMAPLEMDHDGAIWFFTEEGAEKTDALQELNLSFSDEPKATYVSISGHGEIIHDRARIHALWTPFAKPWFPDGPDSPRLVLLKFVPHEAHCWDAPDSKMVRLMAMAASITAGRPVGMGGQEQLSDLQTSPGVSATVP
jgi:general stress protein 26